MTKNYLVHKVRPMKDTLFQICYRYKVSKREVQRINKFSGEDIYYMKEILIPYKGEFQETRAPEVSPEEKDMDETKRREVCVDAMAEAIMLSEKKYQNLKRLVQKVEIKDMDFKIEAVYYLE